jgi:hypothetical protein
MTEPTARAVGQGLAVGLVLAVAAFCLAGGVSMAPADAGCDSHHESGTVCGQSGPLQPVYGVIPPGSPVQPAGSPTAWLAVRPLPGPRLQVRAPPSFPRAPPLSLPAVQS